jgi:hypothetical protein
MVAEENVRCRLKTVEEQYMSYVNTLILQIEDSYYNIVNTYIDLFYSAQHGLVLHDIRNVICALLIIRFILDTLNKNIITAACISCICIATTFMWDRELVHVIRVWRDCWEFTPYYYDFAFQAHRLDLHDKWKMAELNGAMDKVVPYWHQPHMIIWYTFVQLFNRENEHMQEFRTDPISMYVSALKLPDNHIVVYYYYKCFNIILPDFIKSAREIWFSVRNLCQYTFITRIGKKHCPYFFRWHFTFEMIYENIAVVFERMVVRAIWYWQEGVWNRIGHILWERDCVAANGYVDYPRLEAQGRMIVDIKHLTNRSWEHAIYRWNGNMAYDEIDRLILYNKALILLSQIIIHTHMIGVLSGMFHAAFGQYMYVAFVTENVERHVEPRDKTSKYSCGYTAWQDVPLSVRAKMFPPKFWWGWFSRGTDKGNIFLYIPTQIFKMVLRKLRNFLRKLKRKI